MDKEFWLSIQKNEFAIPEGHPVASLTDELLSFLGSTDPELRDGIGFGAFSRWLDQGRYDREDLQALIPLLIANLQHGLGEQDTDAVFLRAFSTLWLALIVERDNVEPVLPEADFHTILEAALAYFSTEQDLRGYVHGKGWAHAAAHTADLFCALVHSPHADGHAHLRVLDCIAGKLGQTANPVLLYGEDARLARAAIIVFIHETLSMDQVREWLGRLSASWNGAWMDEGRARAYFNGRNFLRAIHWRIPLLKVDKVPGKEALLSLIEDTLEKAEPWK